MRHLMRKETAKSADVHHDLRSRIRPNTRSSLIAKSRSARRCACAGASYSKTKTRPNNKTNHLAACRSWRASDAPAVVMPRRARLSTKLHKRRVAQACVQSRRATRLLVFFGGCVCTFAIVAAIGCLLLYKFEQIREARIGERGCPKFRRIGDRCAVVVFRVFNV